MKVFILLVTREWDRPMVQSDYNNLFLNFAKWHMYVPAPRFIRHMQRVPGYRASRTFGDRPSEEFGPRWGASGGEIKVLDF
jgi:hypothetical protein